ncbi:phosphoribosylglycinamide formyltransferase, chloroplastic [Cajanus cajan]|uniref:phosphoribosylglycinamide formyltransferase, chloroplastic n=1 Tax=Cajanus cajan TaxID=3821 RepID=UPI00098DA183|nr:phosphoribosylglycinamide formyltransferase, chloroplastic [Cajanus cajan]
MIVQTFLESRRHIFSSEEERNLNFQQSMRTSFQLNQRNERGFSKVEHASHHHQIPREGEREVTLRGKPGKAVKYGAEYARNNGIPVILFPKAKDESNGLSPSDVVDTLRKFEVDFILLAGYLKLIPAELIRAYQKSILNIHPSLLPAFGGMGYYGMKVHKAVIASGARFSGPTIHFVDEHYDTGRILAQRLVPVLANDTAEELATRVLNEEHQLYVEVVEAVCEDRVVWRKDGVPLIQIKENPNEFR